MRNKLREMKKNIDLIEIKPSEYIYSQVDNSKLQDCSKLILTIDL